MNPSLYKKIIAKKEFSQLPKKDVLMALEKFEKKNLNDWQKIKMTRGFLRKIYSSFSSRKVFSTKGKNVEWYLMKHKSSKERFPYYNEIYERIFPKRGKFSIVDLGAGINGLRFLINLSRLPTPDHLATPLTYGLSREIARPPQGKNVNEYTFSKKMTSRIINYIGVEAIGQFVELMNGFFKKNKKNWNAIHASLFELEKVGELIKKQKKPRIILLLKVIDSLEVMKRDYSKILIKEIAPLSDRIVVSFATRSLGMRKKFSAQRAWILKFIAENFEILDDFEIGGERYVVFEKKD
ncbi:hypothetical protein HYT25_03800 [Candidatus Pacearchaeota archaeon]|nr:hypothetical protein [Candidatus Pacearchaeota archaeon]